MSEHGEETEKSTSLTDECRPVQLQQAALTASTHTHTHTHHTHTRTPIQSN